MSWPSSSAAGGKQGREENNSRPLAGCGSTYQWEAMDKSASEEGQGEESQTAFATGRHMVEDRIFYSLCPPPSCNAVGWGNRKGTGIVYIILFTGNRKEGKEESRLHNPYHTKLLMQRKKAFKEPCH